MKILFYGFLCVWLVTALCYFSGAITITLAARIAILALVIAVSFKLGITYFRKR